MKDLNGDLEGTRFWNMGQGWSTGISVRRKRTPSD